MVAVVMFFATYGSGSAENITVNGDMNSKIRLEIQKTVTTVPGLQNLTLGFVVPETFASPSFRQDIRGFDLKFTPAPIDKKSRTDARGNRVITASWKTPPESIDVQLSFEAVNITSLDKIDTSAPFPLKKVTGDISYYLKATDQVQANDVRIRDLAAELVKDVNTEFAAVQRIITFVVDYISYVTFPEKYDAVYSLASGKGNCQNFSHLSAALMRASGIPVRIVNGVTLNKPLDIKRERAMLTYKMAQGRHSWIEVWFPDLGWVPFDSQQTAMFVVNRFIRIETGIDNNETINDGLVRWSRTGKAKGEPAIREEIHADFLDDKVALNGRKEATGPKSFLLFPLINAKAGNPEIDSRLPSPVTSNEIDNTGVAAPPAGSSKKGFFSNIWLAIKNAFGTTDDTTSTSSSFFSRIKEKTRIAFKAEKGSVKEIPLSEEGLITLGNLEFPADVDFAFPPLPTVPARDGSFEKSRGFFVETAEFVTSKRTQYAQTFVLSTPLMLDRISLALHKFGGDGHLWLDVCRDDNGKPGEIIATSDMVNLDSLSEKPGYRWADFSFGGNKPAMLPGNFWIVLGFTGSPVVNWFYTYGKPVGPAEGTRYKGIFDKEWSGALSYEFNYRVVGMIAK